MEQSFELSSTYYPGATFHLYDQQPPDEDNPEICLDLEDYQIEEKYGRLHNCRVHSIWPPPDSCPSLSITLSSPLSIGIREHITQVWKVSATTHGPLIARIYDPLYCEDSEGLALPFYPIDRAVAAETKAYNLLQPVQGDLEPCFRGLFICPIPHQQRTVYVVLLEYIRGVDLKFLRERGLCVGHKDAITEVATEIWARGRSLGVIQCDMKPRNFILRSTAVDLAKVTSIDAPDPQIPQDKGVSYCSTPTCPLHFVVGVVLQDLRARVVMIDLEDVAFWEPDEPWDHDARERQLVKNRARMKGWMDR